MICVQQTWTSTVSASTENELITKTESLTSLSVSDTSSENSLFQSESEIEEYKSSNSANSHNASSCSFQSLEKEHNNYKTHQTLSKTTNSVWNFNDESFSINQSATWDHNLENDVFESSIRKSSIDSTSSSSSRKSQHKLKNIIDWVQKNGRRASVKCKSMKRKASIPLNDTKKLHCCDPEMKSLNEVLGDKENLRSFREFLTRELSDENLDFWLEVESYRKLKSSKRGKIAQKIFNTYIAQSSKCEVNIDSCVRKEIKQNLQEADSSLFDLAQTKIFELMERDSFRRFSNQMKRRSQA